MEVVRLNQVQPFIQLSIQATTESLHLLCIGIHVMPTILAKAIEFLCMIHSVASLLEGQQFPHLPIHRSSRNVVVLESLLELSLSNRMPLLHGLEVIPPH
jgi:hypothetical protein